jgi:hypothetical protein
LTAHETARCEAERAESGVPRGRSDTQSRPTSPASSSAARQGIVIAGDIRNDLLDIELLMCRRADAQEHEPVGCPDRAGRDDHLSVSGCCPGPPVEAVFDASVPEAVKDESTDVGIGHHCQIRTAGGADRRPQRSAASRRRRSCRSTRFPLPPRRCCPRCGDDSLPRTPRSRRPTAGRWRRRRRPASARRSRGRRGPLRLARCVSCESRLS